VRALAAKVVYRIDPDNPYPRRLTGHVRVKLRNGEVREIRQDHFRGGVDAPLTFDELVRKFSDNCAQGGLASAETERVLEQLTQMLTAPKVDLRPLRHADSSLAP
jgi:2-methylcitrate dehydratase PrpD